MTLKKHALLATTVIAGLTALTSVAVAQTASSSASDPSQTATAVKEVVVTGSRIPNPNRDSPTPVETVNAKTIETSGDVNIGDLIQQLPQAGYSGLNPTNSNFLTRGFGQTQVDLYNLGVSRTLVLVNGRRYVSGSPGTQAVNFNTVPTEFVDHIDVVTGGASSVYGSEAMAGVINIVTEKHYNGVEFFGQTGQTQDGDGISNRIGMKFGSDFADGKGNFMGTLSYDSEGAVYARNRCTQQMCVDGLGGFFTGGDFHQTYGPFYSSYIPQGLGVIPYMNASGKPATTNWLDNGGTATAYASKYGFNREAWRALQVPLKNVKVSVQANYEVAPWANFFMEATYYHGEARNQLEPDPLGGSSIYRDANNVKSNPTCFARGAGPNPNTPIANGAYYCTYGIPLTDAAGAPNPVVPQDLFNQVLAKNPGIAAQNLVLGFQRRMIDIGPRASFNSNDLFRVVTGVNGDVNSTTHYELSLNYGRSMDSQQTSGQVNINNVYNALNATTINGQAVCADSVARAQGCVPFYAFSGTRNSAALAKYIGIPDTYQDYSQEVVVNGFVNGELPFALPAGKPKWVVGFEYRDERSSDVPDPAIQTGLSDVNIAQATAGEYQVWEQFDELRIPLAADLPFVKSLDLNLSGRWSHYTSVGNTTSWAASLEYEPVNWIKFRAQDARAVRAPNIGELYSGANETFPTVTDPCQGLTLSGGQPGFFSNPQNPNSAVTNVGSNKAKACYADPTLQQRITNTTTPTKTGYFIPTQPELQGIDGFNVGNPHLKPETGKTITVGFLLNPKWNDWLRPLSISVDYYDIQINNAIQLYDRTQILNNCYQGPTYDPSNQFCKFITRFGSTSPDVGAVQFLNDSVFNVSTLETTGLDIQASYRLRLNNLPFTPHAADLGSMLFNVTWNHLYSYTTLLAGQSYQSAGNWQYPREKGQINLLYSRGPLEWTLRTQLVGPQCFTSTPCSNKLDGYLGWEAFADTQIRYTFDKKYTVFFGVDNIFNNYVLIGQSQGQPTGWTTDPVQYDGLGRRWYAGFKVKM